MIFMPSTVDGCQERIEQNSSQDKLWGLYFYAEWSDTSREFFPIISSFSEQKLIDFVAIDVDPLEEISSTYNVESVPACQIMKGKEKISTVFYVTDPAQFESQFMSNLGEEEREKLIPKEPSNVGVRAETVPHQGDSTTTTTPTTTNNSSQSQVKSHPKRINKNKEGDDDKDAYKWSVAVSDSVLAAVCFYQMQKLFKYSNPWPMLALSIVGIAASLGVLRFGPYPKVRPIHSFFSDMGGAVAFPLLGFSAIFNPISIWAMIGAPLVLTSGFLMSYRLKLPMYGMGMGGLGTVSILYSGLRSHLAGNTQPTENGMLIGGLLIIFASIMNGKGRILGIRQMDWFHYSLAIALRFVTNYFIKQE